MKESFENRMVEQFRKVLKGYHVEYTPDAWQKLKKNLPQKSPPKRLKWKSLLIGFFGMLIAALIIFQAYRPTLEQEDTIPDFQKITLPKEEEKSQMSSNKESAEYFNTEKIHEKFIENPLNNLGTPLKAHKIEAKKVIAESDTGLEKGNLILLKPIPPMINKEFEDSVKMDLTDFPAKIIATTLKRKNKFKLLTPKINLISNSNNYSHFVGPNKLSIYYSPEFHREEILRNPGFGNGVGIEFEGPLSSSLNLAVGIEYHSQTYSNTKISALDTSRLLALNISHEADSISFLSGHYSFIEVPITFQMKFYKSQRSSLSFDGGFSMFAFLNQNYNSHITIDTIEINKDINMAAWRNIHLLGSVNLGLTYRYSFCDRISINGSLIYKNHLSKAGALPIKLDRVSFKAGITYRLRKKE